MTPLWNVDDTGTGGASANRHEKTKVKGKLKPGRIKVTIGGKVYRGRKALAIRAEIANKKSR